MSNRTAKIIENRASTAKRHFTLNIGLVASDRFSERAQSRVLPANPNTVDVLRVPSIIADIIHTFQARGFNVISYRVAQSGTEPTLVIRVSTERAYADHALLCTANYYAQDCIAVVEGTEGKLVGRYKAIWGDYNPAYFIPLFKTAVVEENVNVLDVW